MKLKRALPILGGAALAGVLATWLALPGTAQGPGSGTIPVAQEPKCTLAAGPHLLKIPGGTGTCGKLEDGYQVLLLDSTAAGVCTGPAGEPPVKTPCAWDAATSAWVGLGGGGGAATPDADDLTKGKVKLTHQLGGSADAPTVVGLDPSLITTTIAALPAAADHSGEKRWVTDWNGTTGGCTHADFGFRAIATSNGATWDCAPSPNIPGKALVISQLPSAVTFNGQTFRVGDWDGVGNFVPCVAAGGGTPIEGYATAAGGIWLCYPLYAKPAPLSVETNTIVDDAVTNGKLAAGAVDEGKMAFAAGADLRIPVIAADGSVSVSTSATAFTADASGTPEGRIACAAKPCLHLDETSSTLYQFTGTNGTNTGWVYTGTFSATGAADPVDGAGDCERVGALYLNTTSGRVFMCTDVGTKTWAATDAQPPYTPTTSGDWWSVPSTVKGALDYLGARVKYLLNYRYVADYNTGGTTTSGLQEAIDSCATGILYPSCKIILPRDTPVLLTSTVTIGTLTGTANSTHGLVIQGQGSGFTSTTHAVAGSVIAWNGATDGSTMLKFLGNYNTQVRDVLIWGCWANSSSHVAGTLVEIVGNNSSSSTPSHITTFSNVSEYGCVGAAAANRPIGYYLHGHIYSAGTNPVAYTGTVASAAATTLTVSGTPWTASSGPGTGFDQTCGLTGTDYCYAEMLTGPGMNLARKIVSNTDHVLTLENPPSDWYETPTSATTFQILSLKSGLDNDYDDQVDFVTWINGSNTRAVTDCIRVFSSQSPGDLVQGFECSYSRYGIAQFAGYVNVQDSYFGTDTGSKAAVECHTVLGSNMPGCGQQRIDGNHFEISTGDFIRIDMDPGWTTNNYYGGEILDNTLSIQGDPAPSSATDDETVLKIEGRQAFTIASNRISTISTNYGGKVILGSAAGAPVAHSFRNNIWLNLYGGAPVITLNGTATIDAMRMDAGGYFNDSDLTGALSGTETHLVTASGSATAFLAYFGDGSTATTGTAVCAAQVPPLTCVAASVRTIATPGTPLACADVNGVPFLVSCK